MKKLLLPILMHVLQFTDSTFPVGTFSFSNGLETAAHLNIVHDASSLELFHKGAAFRASGLHRRYSSSPCLQMR